MMLNRYPGWCYLCKAQVDPEQGVRQVISYPEEVYATHCMPCYEQGLLDAQQAYKIIREQATLNS